MKVGLGPLRPHRNMRRSPALGDRHIQARRRSLVGSKGRLLDNHCTVPLAQDGHVELGTDGGKLRVHHAQREGLPGRQP